MFLVLVLRVCSIKRERLRPYRSAYGFFGVPFDKVILVVVDGSDRHVMVRAKRATAEVDVGTRLGTTLHVLALGAADLPALAISESEVKRLRSRVKIGEQVLDDAAGAAVDALRQLNLGGRYADREATRHPS